MRPGAIGETLGVSPPALSRHLRVLRGCGLVEEATATEDARARVYRLRKGPFSQLSRWAREMENLWADQLAAFAELAASRSQSQKATKRRS